MASIFEILKGIRRNIGRSGLTMCVAGCLVMFVGIHADNIAKIESSIDKLAETMPVMASVTDISGSNQVGLEISEVTVDRLLASDNIKNPVYTGKAGGESGDV